MRLKILYYLLMITVLLGFLVLTGCQSDDFSIDKFSGQSATAIFTQGVNDMRHHNYKRAVQHFEALNALYPFSRYSEQAQLDIIYAYYKKGDADLTIASCDRYIHLYPRSSHIDYAYYMRGLVRMGQNIGVLERYLPSDRASHDETSLKQAFMDFDMVVSLSPRSPYAHDAMMRMVYIRNTLAKHELEIAVSYYKKRAFVAAIRRANDIVRHYQKTAAVPYALVIIIKSYRHLGLFDQAKTAWTVLKRNFPDSVYIQEVA